MVNPDLFPVLRRGASGPDAVESDPGTQVVPFDHERYFDPETITTGNDGSVANPYQTWSDMIAGIDADGVSWLIHFPGNAVSPDEQEIPSTNLTVILEGNGPESFLSDNVHVANTTGGGLTFRQLNLDEIDLNGGDSDILFEDCIVGFIGEEGESPFDGALIFRNSSLGLSQDVEDASVSVTGGNIQQFRAASFVLLDCIVGSADSSGAGDLHVTGTNFRCFGVTFVDGSNIEFEGAAGVLWLDGPSFRSFIDAGVTVVNGAFEQVVRNDGNWPRASALYEGGSIQIDWFNNPYTRFEIDEGASVTFIRPLIRDVYLIVRQDEDGGHEISWNTPVLWTDGLEPEQDTTAGGVSIYRFFFDPVIGYMGWVVGMNMRTAP